MKILVNCFYYYPENTPRAFRAEEITKALSRMGHEVTVTIPDNGFDYSGFEKLYNLKIVKIKGHINYKNRVVKKEGHLNDKNNIVIVKKLSNLIKKKIIRYFTGEGKNILYSIPLYKKLKNSTFNYDYLISIGLPFAIHLGSSLGKKVNPRISSRMLADYGDPFYLNYNVKLAYYFKIIEKKCMKYFDKIIIPTNKSLESYLHLKSKENILIIPQGLNYNGMKLAKFKKNNIPTFAYAGMIYKNIRYPINFFEYISSLKKEFKFIIYTDINNIIFKELIDKYKEKLGDRLVVKDKIGRYECIYELSKMDFIVNFANVNSNQEPSKIIDYILTKRPIFTLDQKEFDKDKFNEFLQGQYVSTEINIEEYNIDNLMMKIFI